MSIINDEMDRLIDEHFAYEVADDVDGVMSTLTDDIERDVVGFPGDAPRGADALRGFYAQLFGLLEQDGYKRLHALPCSAMASTMRKVPTGQAGAAHVG